MQHFLQDGGLHAELEKTRDEEWEELFLGKRRIGFTEIKGFEALLLQRGFILNCIFLSAMLCDKIYI
jgi:hypothetical protein